jgi:hypothetical protein
MPRECPPASRSERAVAGTGSTKRRLVRPSRAIAPATMCLSRRPRRFAQPHNHGRPIGSQDDAVGVLALLASWGWRQGVEGLLRAVTLGSVGWIRSCLATPKTARIELPSTMARDGINPSLARQPVQQGEVDQLPDFCLLPVAQPPAGHPVPRPSSRGSICPGIPLRSTNRIPVRQARSGQRALPLGSTRSGRPQRLNQIPQSIGKQSSAQGLSMLTLTRTAFRFLRLRRTGFC